MNPTRDEIEEALNIGWGYRYQHHNTVVDFAARQYLAFLDAVPERAEMVRSLRAQADKRHQFNRKIENGGTPPPPDPFPAMKLCGEVADYLASLDASAPTDCTVHEGSGNVWVDLGLSEEEGERIVEEMKDGTREPPVPIIDEMDPRHISNPGTGAHVLDHRSPPVVSEEMLDRAIEGYWCNATENTHRTALRRALQAALAPLLEENARLRASAPPVPQEGVSEEMTRDFINECGSVFGDHISDETRTKLVRSALHVALAPLLEENARLRASEEEWRKANLGIVQTCAKAEARVQELEAELATALTDEDQCEVMKRLDAAEARVRELEAALKEVGYRSADWHWVKEREQRKDD